MGHNVMDDEKYMKIAIAQAETALDAGEFPVGCVIVYDGRVVATGARQNTSKESLNEVDHAEIIALREFSGLSQPIETEKATVVCTMEPCLMCYAAIILSGIRRIVYAYEDVMGGGTSCDLFMLPPLYADAVMTVKKGVLRDKSLELFARFFKNPENRYWEKSLLESYTLSQAAGNGVDKKSVR